MRFVVLRLVLCPLCNFKIDRLGQGFCYLSVCYLEKFKEQEFEEKKKLLYFIVELCGVPKMEH